MHLSRQIVSQPGSQSVNFWVQVQYVGPFISLSKYQNCLLSIEGNIYLCHLHGFAFAFSKIMVCKLVQLLSHAPQHSQQWIAKIILHSSKLKAAFAGNVIFVLEM